MHCISKSIERKEHNPCYSEDLTQLEANADMNSGMSLFTS